jgi:hypothetical protein
MNGRHHEGTTAGTLVITLMLLAACSNPSVTPSEPSTETRDPASSPAPDAKGVLEGQVLFEGSTIPRSTRVQNTTDPQDCGTIQSLGNIIISSRNQGIKNVIAALNDVPLPQNYSPQPAPFTLDNRDCQFRPHVAVLTTESSIEAVNSDPIFHSVHLYGFSNLNQALGAHQSKVVQTVKRPGYVIVKCDVHGWMQAFLRVDNHPFHSVSAEDGTFRIENIPVGSYMLEVWHEYFGEQELTVNIKEGASSHVTVYYRDQSP